MHMLFWIRDLPWTEKFLLSFYQLNSRKSGKKKQIKTKCVCVWGGERGGGTHRGGCWETLSDQTALQINHKLLHFIYWSDNFICTFKRKKTDSNFSKNTSCLFTTSRDLINCFVCSSLRSSKDVCSLSGVMHISHVIMSSTYIKDGCSTFFFFNICWYN